MEPEVMGRLHQGGCFEIEFRDSSLSGEKGQGILKTASNKTEGPGLVRGACRPGAGTNIDSKLHY